MHWSLLFVTISEDQEADKISDIPPPPGDDSNGDSP